MTIKKELSMLHHWRSMSEDFFLLHLNLALNRSMTRRYNAIKKEFPAESAKVEGLDANSLKVTLPL